VSPPIPSVFEEGEVPAAALRAAEPRLPRPVEGGKRREEKGGGGGRKEGGRGEEGRKREEWVKALAPKCS